MKGSDVFLYETPPVRCSFGIHLKIVKLTILVLDAKTLAEKKLDS